MGARRGGGGGGGGGGADPKKLSKGNNKLWITANCNEPNHDRVAVDNKCL